MARADKSAMEQQTQDKKGTKQV